MRKILLITIVMLCMASPAKALTYGASNYLDNMTFIGTGDKDFDPIYLFINEVESSLDGTSGVASITYTPGTEPSTPAEGMLYYNAAGNNLKLYTGAAFVDIDMAGASSLNTAYGVGSKIEAGTLEVEIEVADSSNNPALRLDFDDATTNAQDVLVIDNAGDDADAVSIQFNGTAGDDLRGTGDAWNISYLGVAGLVGATIGSTDLTFTEPSTNDVFLLADADAQLTIGGTSKEDINLNFATANTLTVSSGTALDKVVWGAVDDHQGLNALSFDVAVANTITQAGTGAADDLTIQQTTSGQDASLILQSSGTGTDALSLISSVADISLVSADNITRTAADNITDVTTDGAYTLTIGGSTDGKYISTVADTYSMIAVDTILIRNTQATKDITINSVLGTIIIEAEENAADAILITADGDTASTLRLFNDTGTGASAATETDASIQLQSDVGGIGLYTALNGANAIRLETNGGIAEGIILHSNQGTSVTEGTNAVQLLADVGGIGLESNANLAKSISLVSDGGTTSSIYVQADTGVAASATTQSDASIQLVSDLGGIGLLSGLAAVDAIRIETTAAAAQITVQNKLGTTAAAAAEFDASIQLYSEVGGIGLLSKLNAADSVRIEANGGTSEAISILSNLGTGASSIGLVSDAGGITLDAGADDAITLTAGTGGVVFTSGQTRKETLNGLGNVIPDGSNPAGTIAAAGTNAQSLLWNWQFDADGGTNGDDIVFLRWNVPDGYVTDSLRLNVGWSFSDAETNDDDVVFDMTVLAVAQGTAAAGGDAWDAAGTVFTQGDTNLDAGAADNDKLIVTQLNPEVLTIAVDDTVIIMFWVDETASDLTASGTCDVHFFEMEWESTE